MKIRNLERLKRKLKAMPAAAKEEIRAAMDQSAREITDLMRRSAPVASGDLRDSIGYTFGAYNPANSNVRGVTGGGTGGHELSVTIHAGDAKAWYAALVEFGTSAHEILPKRPGGLLGFNDAQPVPRVDHPGATAQPFFFPSWRLGRKRARSRISRAIGRAARKVAAGG